MGIFPKLFKASTKIDELAVVFDVGSSSVGGALFYMQASGIPKFIFSIRENIKFQKEVNPEKFLDYTMRALNDVAEQVASSGLGSPKKIYVVLSSPWYVSQNRTIKLEKNTPFIFNAKLADSLIDREVKLFEDEHLIKYVDAGSPVKTIELKNIKIMLNGYEVVDPCDQKAKDLEMTVFISISSEDVLTQIETIMARHFHSRDVIYSSFLMTFFTVVRDSFMHQDDFLLIDIGGEITDISMIKKNTLRESASFPLGLNFIIRGISKQMSCSLEEAKSIFSLYKDNHMEESLREKIHPIILQLQNEWLSKFQYSLANLSHDISIPANIFISIEKEFADFFANIIKTEQFNQYTLTESKFKITFLNNEYLHDTVTFEENTNRDASLAIGSVYINRFLKQKNAKE